jgi:spoIIIJ-associated protein
MNDWEIIIKEIVSRMGFTEYRVEILKEENKASLYIYDEIPFLKENISIIVDSLNHILQMVARKNNVKGIFLDVNHYRQDREKLISELARAAAKKAIAINNEIPLPAMNSYERRIVHTALATHPDVVTESIGVGKERHVLIKPISFKKEEVKE